MKTILISTIILSIPCLGMISCNNNDETPLPEPIYTPLVYNSNDAYDLTSNLKPQLISSTKGFSLKDKFGYGHEVEMEGTGTVDVDMEIYPFYAFESNPSNGDYYLVEAAVTVHSGTMWGEPKFTYYKQDDDSLYSNAQYVYAFYLKSLDFQCCLLDSNDNVVGQFPAGNFPTPQTTIETTSYETGFDFGITGKLKVMLEGDEVIAFGEIEPEISIKNEAKHNIETIEITNNSDSQSPAFTYMLNSNISVQQITPLTAAINNATFYQSWLWRVPETTDFGTQRYKIKFYTSVTYGGFSAEEAKIVNPYILYTVKDNTTTQDPVVVDVVPPSRVPMGQISIENREDGRIFVTDINIYSAGTDSLVINSGDNVYAPGDVFSACLDEHDYDITIKKGSSDDNMQTYKYSKGALSIIRDQEVHIYTDYYFKPK